MKPATVSKIFVAAACLFSTYAAWELNEVAGTVAAAVSCVVWAIIYAAIADAP